MHTEHFGIRENPFSIAPDPRYLYMSAGHQEAFAHLLYGIRGDGGFVLLTGEVGTGKTTVCRCLLDQCPPDTNIAFILNPKVNAVELLAAVCDELGITCTAGADRCKVLVDRLNEFLLEANAAGRETVLIIDEAQNLDSDVLEQVRLLTNLETNQRKLLRIIMLGQPELQDKLARPELRQLAQRITARYHLGALRRREIAPYLTHRLAVAGITRPVFSSSCIRRLYPLSRGIPRVINILCDRAMLGAYVEGRDQVDEKILARAAREVFGTGSRPMQRSRLVMPGALAALLVLAAGAALGIAYVRSVPDRIDAMSQAPVRDSRISPLPPLKLSMKLGVPGDAVPDDTGTAVPVPPPVAPEAK